MIISFSKLALSLSLYFQNLNYGELFQFICFATLLAAAAVGIYFLFSNKVVKANSMETKGYLEDFLSYDSKTLTNKFINGFLDGMTKNLK
jgi:hypothetical protein